MFSGVMIWVSVKCLETICIVVDAIQIKIEVNWIDSERVLVVGLSVQETVDQLGSSP